MIACWKNLIYILKMECILQHLQSPFKIINLTVIIFCVFLIVSNNILIIELIEKFEIKMCNKNALV